jgi:hypothetical protein
MARRLPSKGEVKIRSWLFTNEIEFEPEKEFEGLVNPDTGINLRFDFYLPKKNIAIEFDGFHHYSPKSKYHSNKYSFISQKIRDREKDKYCKENGIELIRIGYDDYQNIFKILTKKILNNEAEEGGEE